MKANDTINGRTPDEIKMGLECCSKLKTNCSLCPYAPTVDGDCMNGLVPDALAYIQQLERERDDTSDLCKELIETNNFLFAETVEEQNKINALRKELEQVKHERDAAVEGLHGWCEACVHWGSEDQILFCDGCTHNYPFEHETNFTDNWQWRGVQEVE